MKTFFSIFTVALLLVSCKNESKDLANQEAKKEIAYVSFGNPTEANNAIAASDLASLYESISAGDSLSTKVVAKVDEVCQAKGCWMKLDLGDEKQVMVKFRDYGFFVPKNIAGKEVIINGMAYVSETSVAELRHYAQDAGESDEDIAKITDPERTYAFLADGVLLKEE
ncbi:DUF4920 domain-containing protein [Mangrovimonas sp. DI 80]|uniref:DUF4920 domain-containing protein n=1 Tax=Mangrovimonas sp. DI 80 TaxID=1779330 RepID=UPI0009787120|nr:DUF4920 domain-containing protein [Mangrovimonas sp. DI 80]OMP30369.1 DUF4920 domain-containing protein [Mangrovimonas sp. DI 80]